MKAKNPNNLRLEECTLLPAFHDGKDWVRFGDGGEHPLANLDGVQGVEFDRSWIHSSAPGLGLEPKHTDTWHDESKRNKGDAPFRSGT